MRRFLPILLALAASLLVSISGRASVHASHAEECVVAEISAGHTTADQWLCERACNSDLNFSRTQGQVTPSQTAPASAERFHSGTGYTPLRSECEGRDAEIRKIILEQNRHNLAASPQPVDQYVYRLRRLII